MGSLKNTALICAKTDDPGEARESFHAMPVDVLGVVALAPTGINPSEAPVFIFLHPLPREVSPFSGPAVGLSSWSSGKALALGRAGTTAHALLQEAVQRSGMDLSHFAATVQANDALWPLVNRGSPFLDLDPEDEDIPGLPAGPGNAPAPAVRLVEFCPTCHRPKD